MKDETRKRFLQPLDFITVVEDDAPKTLSQQVDVILEDLAQARKPGGTREGGQFAKMGAGQTLTPGDVDAAAYYQSGGMMVLNSMLRSGGLYGLDVPYQTKQVEALDSAISKSSLDRDIVSYRVVTPDVAEKLGANIGRIVKDKGFVSVTKSTSALHQIKRDLDFQPGDPTTTIVIRVRKGAHALDMNYVVPRERNKYPWQDEVLLPRNTNFKISREGKRVVLTYTNRTEQ